MSNRKPSKLRAMPTAERMLMVLPRTGLATDGQLDHLATLFPEGGQPAMQALLNLMASGVKDCVSWSQDCWHPDAVGACAGYAGDKLYLEKAVPLPPTAGSSLVTTELCLEEMFKQLRTSLEKVTLEALATYTTPSAPEGVLQLASADLPRQVVLMVQRLHFTHEVEQCVRERRQIGCVARPYSEIQKALAERQMRRDLSERDKETLMALQTLLHEQQAVMAKLMDHKEADTLDKLWNEQVRIYHRDASLELQVEDMAVAVGFEYDAGPQLITTEFTHTLRWAYLSAMLTGRRVLVLVGPPASGKTGMLNNVGQLLGTLPTTIRATDKLPADEAWWRRCFTAAKATSGGSLAPFILSRAHEAPEAALEMAVRLASEFDIALCATMSPGPAASSRCAGVFAGLSVITMPPISLEHIATGQLAAEGLQQPATLAGQIATLLDELKNAGSKQRHYDFGARTLMQLCVQIGVDRKPHVPDAVTILSVVQRCLAPQLVSDDLQLLKRLIIEHDWKKEREFKEGELTPPSVSKAGRWYTVAEEIGSITKIEPDCLVLPVPPSDEAAFFEEFCKYLNRNTYALVRLPGTLSEMSPEELLGTMPRKGEEVKDGILITLLRKAMEDHPEDQSVWIAMLTGSCGPEMNVMWEALHELLNDSGCLNLATGEQLRLTSNLRFLFIMPEAGATHEDTFSRTAVVYTDP